MLVSIFTGFAAGAVHVVGGADHLVAIAPTALKHPRLAFKNGLAWGLGHSAGVVGLSAIAICVKDLVQIQKMSTLAEFSVGIVLLVAGVFALKRAFGLHIHTHDHNHGKGYQHQHVHFHLRGNKQHGVHTHAVTSLGVLHGLAGASHLLAVIPALALPPIGAFTYIISYLFGSIAAMQGVVLAISLATFKAGRKALPLMVGFIGGISILTGFFWVQKTSSYIL
ncbi:MULTISPECIES: hydantoin utilization protein A [Prochlorococcus]|uniref:hydantoin utilization protein A n=1 Tax=Prochlorococcus TaxID=1218 RepID=UPI000533A543|nr:MULTISPECIES: hydantoin utilization protein A [Prochlorococcus]KGG11990.1 Nickel transporter UreH [Prochlorococcus sp. MIT 0601]